MGKKKITTTTTVVTEEIINKEKTEIVCILDRSGSMSGIIGDMIGGFNTFLEEQKQLSDECYITIALFDDHYSLLYDKVDIKKIKPITKSDWIPRGTTALYDAIGKTINTLNERYIKEGRPDKILVCIVTDGYENASHEYNNTSVKNLINDKEKDDWAFLYLAANQNSFDVGTRMGFSGGNTLNFNASSSGSEYVNKSLSTMSKKFRSMSTQDALYSRGIANLAADIEPDVKNDGTVAGNFILTTAQPNINDLLTAGDNGSVISTNPPVFGKSDFTAFNIHNNSSYGSTVTKGCVSVDATEDNSSNTITQIPYGFTEKDNTVKRKK